MLSRLTVYGALFIARDNSILCGKPATVTHGHAPAVSLDNLQSSGGSFAFKGNGMTSKDGKPCKKCGANEWNSIGGRCMQCKREYNALYYQTNYGKEKDRYRQYRRTNPAKVRERTRRWQQANPDKTKAFDSISRTRKTVAGGSFTAAEWKALVDHYGGKCLCCGRDDVKLTADHVIPVARGGTSNIDNLQPLCGVCNSRKGDKIIDYRPESGLGRWIQRKLFG